MGECNGKVLPTTWYLDEDSADDVDEDVDVEFTTPFNSIPRIGEGEGDFLSLPGSGDFRLEDCSRNKWLHVPCDPLRLLSCAASGTDNVTFSSLLVEEDLSEHLEFTNSSLRTVPFFLMPIMDLI